MCKHSKIIRCKFVLAEKESKLNKNKFGAGSGVMSHGYELRVCVSEYFRSDISTHRTVQNKQHTNLNKPRAVKTPYRIYCKEVHYHAI